MYFLRHWYIFLLSVALMATPAWAARHRRYHHHYHHHYVHHRYYGAQREMGAARIRQIQAALIHQHYLKGKPNGIWDAKTQAAMRSYQANHGWQTKLTPDARALIALGLGPKSDEAHVQNNKIRQPQPSISYADTLAAVQIIPK